MAHVDDDGTRALGATGLRAAAIGFGGGALGEASLDDDGARALVHAVRARGVRFFDTARSYGESEARLARALDDDGESVVCTKLGYGVAGVADWTYDAVARGVDEARARLARDTIDVVALHSCPRHVLERGEVVRALEDARAAGRVRVTAYAGDDEALWWAVEHGPFGLVIASYSVVDQKNARALARAKEKGQAVVVKRALGNMAFAGDVDPRAPDRVELQRRFRALALDLGPDPFETLVRFASQAPFVDVTLIGTRKASRVEDAIRAHAKGPLDEETRARIVQRYAEVGSAWDPVV